MKWIVGFAFLLIIGSLASACFFMMRGKGKSENMVKALGFRVGFSVILFLGILFANWMGWISATGVTMR